MNNNYDLIVYIGRFSPQHIGHMATIKHASTLSKNVLVLIGSASSPRTIRNPWTFEERKTAVEANAKLNNINLYCRGINDYAYNDNLWIKEVGNKVQETIGIIFQGANEKFPTDAKIAIIGHDKDHSSYYLNYFPQWDFIEMEAYPSESDRVDSTKIRQLMFTNQISFTDNVVLGNQVRDFVKTDEFIALREQWDYVEDYKNKWKAAPYTPTLVTVDAVVEQSGHILLVQRGNELGKGLWAMPGGFLKPTERIIDGVIRELREETKLKVPEKVLRGSIKHNDVFDDPSRSLRGRTITHVYSFKLNDASALPKVKGNDDAMDARWVSLTEFQGMQNVMFEDHYSIIQNMISRG